MPCTECDEAVGVVRIRIATTADLPELRELIPPAVRALSQTCYSSAQTESAIRHVFGPDTQLLRWHLLCRGRRAGGGGLRRVQQATQRVDSSGAGRLQQERVRWSAAIACWCSLFRATGWIPAQRSASRRASQSVRSVLFRRT